MDTRAKFEAWEGKRTHQELRDIKNAWTKNHPETMARSRRSARLKFYFALTEEGYDALLTSQGGVCAVCGGVEKSRDVNGRLRRLAVDHDHTCCSGTRSCGGCIRGLLCNPCNRAIGYLNDTPELLDAAAGYLRSASRRRLHLVAKAGD